MRLPGDASGVGDEKRASDEPGEGSVLPISLRPATDADLPFLANVYASTRTEELAQVPWTDEQKAAFLLMQFQAQHVHYHQHYQGADFLVVECDGQPAGRLYLYRMPRETRLVDIAILPDWRGAGIGTHLLRDLIAECDVQRVALTIHVERNNPALRWYERHGFVLVEDKGVYLFLRRNPETLLEP